MARKASSDAHGSHAHGFGDIIGLVLLAVALLMLVAQLSFDPHDIAGNRVPPNNPVHNWIGPVGAHLAFVSFFLLGLAGYTVPVLMGFLGLGYWLDSLSYMKRRWPWALVLLLATMGLLHLANGAALLTKWTQALNPPSVGGFVGMSLYDYFFRMFGAAGAAIIYGTFYLVSLLFLTNFQLGQWVRRLKAGRAADPGVGPAASDEQVLEKRARDLKKQARELQEQVERSGLGPDMKPVPAPTIRDLSIPQTKSGKVKKPVFSAPPLEPAAADEGEVIPAHEVTAATTEDILGRKSDLSEPSQDSNGKAEPPAANGSGSDEKEAESGREADGASTPNPGRGRASPSPLPWRPPR